jgi:hypothetical protein
VSNSRLGAKNVDPQSTREADASLRRLGAVTILLELSIIGLGAAALGRWFRLYSILTFAAVVVFWGLTFVYAPRLGAGNPRPGSV